MRNRFATKGAKNDIWAPVRAAMEEPPRGDLRPDPSSHVPYILESSRALDAFTEPSVEYALRAQSHSNIRLHHVQSGQFTLDFCKR